MTDAAGRALFCRAATPLEVTDALRSADTAQAEGEAAMDQIAYDRLFSELNSKIGVESIDQPILKGDSPVIRRVERQQLPARKLGVRRRAAGLAPIATSRSTATCRCRCAAMRKPATSA